MFQVWGSDGQPPLTRIHKKRWSTKLGCASAKLFCASRSRTQDVQRLWWENWAVTAKMPHHLPPFLVSSASLCPPQVWPHLKTGRLEQPISTWMSRMPSTSWSTLESPTEKATRSKVGALKSYTGFCLWSFWCSDATKHSLNPDSVLELVQISN